MRSTVERQRAGRPEAPGARWANVAGFVSLAGVPGAEGESRWRGAWAFPFRFRRGAFGRSVVWQVCDHRRTKATAAVESDARCIYTSFLRSNSLLTDEECQYFLFIDYSRHGIKAKNTLDLNFEKIRDRDSLYCTVVYTELLICESLYWHPIRCDRVKSREL